MFRVFSNRTYVITRYRINMPFAYLKKKNKKQKTDTTV